MTNKAIEIEDLVKTYNGNIKALKGLNLNIEKGDFFALLGPNGAGKSTTIGILSSLVNKTSGRVSVFGFDIDHDLEQAKSKIGLVPQEFNFNIFEKVIDILLIQAGYYGVEHSVAKDRAKKYLTQLGLWEKRNQKAMSLSGGMKRRLMIARALMHDPELLILDEPTAGVDIELRRSMWDFLIKINNEGKTIVLTTHYLEEAEVLCRNIGIIDKGVLVENTSMQKLLASLDIETFIFDFDKCYSNFALNNFEYRIISDLSVEIDVKKEDGLNKVFEELNSQNITVLSMRNKANRLEELFVRLIKKGN